MNNQFSRILVRGTGLALLALLAGLPASAQQPQIPTLQVCNLPGIVTGQAKVVISERADATHSGSFTLEIRVECDPNTGYPVGTFIVGAISMSDSAIQGAFKATTIDQITVTGKHTPTAYLNGRCAIEQPTATAPQIKGCKYWLMVVNNKQAPTTATNNAGTPDIIGFLVLDNTGKRIAYGTGPVVSGDVNVSPTGN